MAVFPVSPTTGQEETVLGRTFVYDGYGWVVKVSGGHVIQNAAGDNLPAQDALQFGDGFTVTDETGKTVARLAPVDIRNVSGGFSLTAADGNKYIRFTGVNNLNVTIPNTLEVGKPVTFWQAGAGRLTLVPDSGVTLNGPNTTYSQNTAMQLMKVADNLFDIIGGV